MQQRISISGQLLLYPKARLEAERFISRYGKRFDVFEAEFHSSPDLLVLRIKIVGAQKPGELEAALTRLGCKALCQLRLATWDRTDYLFLGPPEEVTLAENLAYKMEGALQHVSSMSPQQVRKLEHTLDLLFPEAKTGTTH